MESEAQSQALAVLRPMGLGYLRELSRVFVTSKFFPGISTEQAMAKIKAGEELGIPPVAAMQSIYFFDNKITLSATLMASLIQKSGRFAYRVRRKDPQACEIEFFERGESLGIESFTLEEARQAGLLTKDNWRKYPKAMLYNRAMSNGAKTFCPAVFAGNVVYTPDEIDPDLAVNPDTGEIIDGAAVEVVDDPPASTQQKVAIQRLLTEAGRDGAWLEEYDLPPVAQMTQADYERARGLLLLKPFVPQPKEESDAPPAPEQVTVS